MSTPATAQSGELAEVLAREAAAAGATVHGPMGLDEAFTLIRSLATSQRILAWRPSALGIPDAWDRLTSAGLEPVSPSVPADREARLAALADIGEIDLGLTSTLGALADTGSIVVASGPDRPRLAWLLPNRHVALVDVDGIHPTMAAFLDATQEPLERLSHLAFVTGPSRTADIELTMTRGVHGPRELHLILVRR